MMVVVVKDIVIVSGSLMKDNGPGVEIVISALDNEGQGSDMEKEISSSALI